jgi:hypothetical protein
MNTSNNLSRPRRARMKDESVTEGDSRRKGSNRTPLVASAAAVAFLLTACGGSPSSISAVVAGSPTSSATSTATPTPTQSPIAKTPCTAVDSQKASGGETYICTLDETGKLIWLQASQSKDLKAKLAAASAAKAAADKAAADAAAEKAAADKAAADAAAAEAARAAEAKAAQEAAAAKAAADAAAKAAAPPAPQYVAPAAPPPAAPPAASGCDPNYSGCVPIASDVDCAGGSGNGPAYVKGPVRVIGSDIYGLDGKDNDGIGCEG